MRKKQNNQNNNNTYGLCEHFSEINRKYFNKLPYKCFGFCSICKKRLSPGSGINSCICLCCGFQACYRINYGLNHGIDHYKAKPDHSIYLLLTDLSIHCFTCNHHFDKNSINIPKFIEKAEIFYKNELAIYKQIQTTPKSPPGLHNLGHTCYANSVIQSLYACEYFKNALFKSEKKISVVIIPKESEIMPINIKLAQPLGSAGKNLCRLFYMFEDPFIKTICPLGFIDNSRNKLGFKENKMHDAHEFLLGVLNCISDEIHSRICRIIKNNLNPKGNKLASYCKVVPEFFIENLFKGQLVSETTCPDCLTKTRNYEDFVDLSLPLVLPEKLAFYMKLLNLFKLPNAKKNKVNHDAPLNNITNGSVNTPLVNNKPYQSSIYLPISKTNDIKSFSTNSNEYSQSVPHQNSHELIQNEDNLANISTRGRSHSACDAVEFFNINHSPNYIAGSNDSGSSSNINGNIKSSSTIDSKNNLTMDTFDLTNILHKRRCFSFSNDVVSSWSYYPLHRSCTVNMPCKDNCDHIHEIKAHAKKHHVFYTNSNNESFDSNIQINTNDIMASEYSKICNLEASLNNFFATEKLDENNKFLCSNCTKHKGENVFTSATRKYRIAKLPKHLIIHLKRFKNTGYRYIKIGNHVNFNVILNLKNYALTDNISCLYSLIAVIEHVGSLDEGHYIAYTRHPLLHHVWFGISDNQVYDISIESVLKRNAYLLFYTLID